MSEYQAIIDRQHRHQGKPTREKPVTHWVVPAFGGPIVSDGGLVVPPEVSAETKQDTVGHPGTYRVACDQALVLGVVHNGTDKTYLVSCPKCMAVEAFAKNYVPHPRDERELERIAQLNAMRLEAEAKAPAPGG